ncbi:sigma-70 family RNA polymerase sigma factor [Enterococcus asini]|uniref:sigma-70 family RNA polymerase sigma factor n=1 Tax=Enterococcus asini TaxID=57732 RepID=UPI000E51C36A|nr:sigma-70 family RNA polymerase sigma factor [Enterococcus asini]RGW10552.1 sigma-70 family RNA polymerase sigma factor [Enterococcus asini]
MTEMDITYIFIRYISVTIKRQAGAHYGRSNKISYYENKEFIDSLDAEINENSLSISSTTNETIEEKIASEEVLFKSLNFLDDEERWIVFEKFINQRSDNDIGKDFSVSSQMISKKKRKILKKLKSFF